MKRSNRMILLASILVVVSLATFILSRYEEKQEQIRTSDAVVLELPADGVTGLSWEYATGDTLSFSKVDSVWSYDGDAAFPVSQDKVAQILSHFEQFGVRFIIENVDDYAQYGLDDPECTIRLTTEETTYNVKLGDFSKMDEQRYVDIGDGNVYLVGEDPLNYVDAALSTMIAHDDTPGFQSVVDINFSGAENYTIYRDDDSTPRYSSDDIYFTADDDAPLDTSKIRTYLNTITALDLDNYVTYNATEEELASYGLDDPYLSVTINYTDTDDAGQTQSGTCTLHISENPTERAAADTATEAGEAAEAVTKYVRIGDSSIVYTMTDVDYGILKAAGYDDLRHKEVFWGDFDSVYQIDATLEDQTHTLLRRPEDEEDEDSALVWFYQDQQVDTDTLAAALENLTADSFTQDLPAGKEELSLVLHLDNEAFPTVSITLYRLDGTLCLAQIDGESVSLLSRSSVIELVEALQAIILS